MKIVTRAVVVMLVLGVALAACGHGGARSVLPSTSGAARGGGSPGTRSTNVALFNGELWYGAGGSLLGVPLQPGGQSAELDASYDGIVDPVPVAMTVAPDGTLYDLVSDGETSWALQAYAPGTFGAAGPEETIRGNGYPQQIVLVGDGIDVLSTVGFNTSSTASTLWTYVYGAGNNPQPIRTLNLGRNVTDVASDDYDHLFVAHRGGAGISVYRAAATCNCSPIRTIATGSKSNDAIAVSADGIAYVLSKDPSSGAVTIDAYAPGNDGPAPTRSIGPIAASRGTPTGGITVDSDGKLYVNFKDARNRNSVDVYAATANGAVAPLQTIAAPVHGGYVTAIAIGPLVQAPPPTAPAGVLFVLNHSTLYSYPLSANGAAAPTQTIDVLRDPSGRTYQGAYAPMVTTVVDRRLYVSRFAGDGPVNAVCSFAIESIDAGFAANFLDTLACPYGSPSVARGNDGALDTVVWGSSQTTLYRDGINFGSLTVPIAYTVFTTDSTANIYFARGDRVDEYAANAVTGATPIRSISFGGAEVARLAVAPDGTLYAATATSQPPDYAVITETIQVVPPGQTGPARSITGGFASRGIDPVAGLAVDSAGELYVAVDLDPTGSKINVYAPGASGNATPVRSIADPVPSGTQILSITIFP